MTNQSTNDRFELQDITELRRKKNEKNKKAHIALLAMIIALSAFSAVSVSAAEIDQNIFVGSDFPYYGKSDYKTTV